MNAIEAITRSIIKSDDVGHKEARQKAVEMTKGFGISGVEVVPRNIESNIGGYFLEAVYDPSISAKLIDGKLIKTFSDLTVAIADQPADGAVFLAGELMAYGNDYITRMSFTDPMEDIIIAANSHREALSQIFEPQNKPFVPPSLISSGKANLNVT